MVYQKIRKINKLYFGYEEIARALNITLGSARVSATRLVRSGLLVRLKRNLYVTQERWDALGQEEKFTLANLLQSPSYISLMTALSYYQVTTQIQRSFFESVALYRTKEVMVKDEVFNYTKMEAELYFGFCRQKGFFIATLEKAFLDALYLASLKKYSFDLTSIDFDKLDKAIIKSMAKKFPLRTQKILKKKWIS